jgi:hypothetical protein
LELNETIFAHSQEVLRQALAGGKSYTRSQMEQVLNQAGISTAIPQSLVHLLMCAELNAVICNGPWQDKQNTYVLVDENIPPGPPFDHEAALAELARRYFTSHGPASLKDYIWWSGLTTGEARAGIELASASLEREQIDGQSYWSAQDSTSPAAAPPDGITAHLLPNYDEYVVAYTDRSAIFDPAYADRLHMRGGVLNNVLILNGWQRQAGGDG